MYTKLRVQLKIPFQQDEMARPLDRTVQVKRGTRQVAIATPCFFINYVLEAQKKCEMSCILSGLNISLVSYTDDIFNISKTTEKISKTLQKLKTQYLKS